MSPQAWSSWAHPMPFSLKRGLAAACPLGKRPPRTKSTFTPSRSTQINITVMASKTVFTAFLLIDTANIAKNVVLFRNPNFIL